MMDWSRIPPRTPDQEEELERRLRRMHARFDAPLEVFRLGDGFIARRAGIAGCGATELDARADLLAKENADLLNPSPGD